MKETAEFQIETKVREQYDVLVVGGGIAGISAAVAAGRAGSRVLLIEKGINLGGLATAGLISWYEPLCDGEGQQMVGGIAEELIRLAVRSGFNDLPTRWGGEKDSKRANDRFSCYFSPTFLALALDGYVREAGVRILFDTRATYPVMDGHQCRGILVENVNGREFYPAKVVIDATGDATIAYRAGIPCEVGDNYLSYVVHDFDMASVSKCSETQDLVRFRRWKNSGSDLAGAGHPAGMKLFHGDSAEELTEFVLTGKQKMLSKYAESKKDERDIMALPSMPQFRKIRHIIGKKVFLGTEDGQLCSDPIGVTGDFRYAGRHYCIPYSTLYHPDYPNLLAAGRIISSAGDGWEITRVIPVCALTGQAAGTAAALALRYGGDVRTLPYAHLLTSLKDQRVIVEMKGAASL